MQIIDINTLKNGGTNGPVRSGFSKVNQNTVYSSAVIDATRALCGFDRMNTDTMGLLQYCHDASSGVIENISSAGVYSQTTSQTHFADGETLLADRTFAHYSSPGHQQFSYWYQGTLVTVNGIKTIQLPDDNSTHYVEYISNGDIAIATNETESIVSGSLVAIIKQNATSGNLIWFADERHGIVMDGQTHLHLHHTQGFAWEQGCDVEGLANNGTVFTKITSGEFEDEDIEHELPEATTAPFLYVDTAGNWDISATDNNKLAHFVDTAVVYNPLTGGLGALTGISNAYVVMAILATNNVLYPYLKLVGQSTYANRNTARAHLDSAIHEIEDTGLPTSEGRVVASFIIHNETTGQIETGSDGEVWLDHRRRYPVSRF